MIEEINTASSQLTLRTIAALLFTALAIFWCVFAVTQLLSLDTASERAAGAGAVLFVLNLLAIGVTTGLFGRGPFARFSAEAILVAMIAVSFWLYPSPPVWQGPFRLAAHATDLLALSLAITANYMK